MKPQRPKPAIKLVLADVDGTLVDSQKRITARAQGAIRNLRAAGIGFAITSGRPPRGMKMVSDAVAVTAPIASFNGGTLVRPDDFEIIESLTLPREVAEKVIARIGAQGLDVWVYAGLEWYLRDPQAPHREKEEHTVQFAPTVVADFSAALAEGVAKIVGVSDDLALVERVEKLIQNEFASGSAPSVSAARSQPYYLDVTHPRANKGNVVEMLVATQGIPADAICTMGDMPNDVLMFVKSGFAIAMGQSSAEVQAAADRVSTGLDDEGFARGIEDFVLGDL